MTLTHDRTYVVGRACWRTPIVVVCVAVLVIVGLALVRRAMYQSKPVETPDARSAEATLAPGGEYDFGYLEPGAKREAVLAVTSPFSRPVSVLNVRSGCPCIEASALKKTFGAGEALGVRVVFTATERPEDYAKRLYIETNDPKDRLIWVVIKADVGLPLATEEPSPALGAVPIGQETEEHVAIINRGAKPARLLYSTSSLPGCVLKVPAAAVPPGGQVEVTVVLTATSAGAKTATFDVATDVPTQPSFPVTVGFVAGAPSSP